MYESSWERECTAKINTGTIGMKLIVSDVISCGQFIDLPLNRKVALACVSKCVDGDRHAPLDDLSLYCGSTHPLTA